ncbi:ribokinase [Staphylococcus petrasii]|uniref:Ribokinase n=1 Tax=Staphylococcus petrasii TaxID=1276936 RepID=A0A380FXP5_9STAP|nr:ribokinase [Staphylococcus petrasii]PNZ26778.1 ribokinase [Staphylococcus petrasii]TGE11859.1 ribokinase [Staphylococcus petrasii]TGE16327.1 ribokinase [Staphylococcus petrasii]SUM42758.1 ribokinase [Staphylococcus petrasii]
MERQIYVIGSMSMDLVVATSIVPGKGETVLGDSFFTTPGGKGANQAVAAARLGQDVHMIGRIGNDTFGKDIFQNLKNNQINVEHVKPTEGPSGTAHITLADNDNSIIVVPSANNEVTPDYVQEALASTQPGDIVLLQQEIPAETVEIAVKYCYEHDVISILNPAPYREISDDVLEQVTYLTPNETESENMFEGDVDGALERYPDKLIVTLGELGAVYHNGLEQVEIKGFKREVKDTTGAGDTFNGALAVGLQKGYDLAEAVTFANLAASYSVTGMGAQGGMPTFEDLEADLEF